MINVWFVFAGWFGIRKDFCHFLLSLCPFLQEYANIAYSLQSDEAARRAQASSDDAPSLETKPEKRIKKTELLKPVVPVVSIDMPDWISMKSMPSLHTEHNHCSRMDRIVFVKTTWTLALSWFSCII